MVRVLGCLFALALCGCALDRTGAEGEGGSTNAATTTGDGGPASDGAGPTSTVTADSASSGGEGTGGEAVSAGPGGSVASSTSGSGGDEAGSSAATSGSSGGGPVCGNGVVESGEECDEGDRDPGDGCDADCIKERPDDCPGTAIPLGEDVIVITGSTSDASDTFDNCGGELGRDVVFAVTSELEGLLRADLHAEYSDSLIAMREVCDPEEGTIGCDFGGEAPSDSYVDTWVEAGDLVFVVVDSHDEQQGEFTLTLELQQF